jgi:hypothetical protein
LLDSWSRSREAHAKLERLREVLDAALKPRVKKPRLELATPPTELVQ